MQVLAIKEYRAMDNGNMKYGTKDTGMGGQEK